ncbi:hypothetical protein [Scytonema sp. HK-05]
MTKRQVGDDGNTQITQAIARLRNMSEELSSGESGASTQFS